MDFNCSINCFLTTRSSSKSVLFARTIIGIDFDWVPNNKSIESWKYLIFSKLLWSHIENTIKQAVGIEREIFNCSILLDGETLMNVIIQSWSLIVVEYVDEPSELIWERLWQGNSLWMYRAISDDLPTAESPRTKILRKISNRLKNTYKCI